MSRPDSAYDPARLVRRVGTDLVGLAREAEVLAVALAAGRHVVLEGPPGTGKSTMLRAIADEAGVQLCFVEGNAELTPARLVGSHDPAIVLSHGYREDAFVAGPLAEAVRDGGLLYLEELNRIPEESLNVLITALAEGELHVPRHGRIPAAPGFRLIAAMNPFDAIGTARIGQAVYDRLCRISIGYQDEQHECEIVRRATATAATPPAIATVVGAAVDRGDDIEIAVALVRATRDHDDIRLGSSVRGAIDMTLLTTGLRALRPAGDPAAKRRVLVDAALAALSGRIRVDEGCDRTAEDVIVELLDRILAARGARADGEDDAGKAERPGSPLPQEQSRGRILTGDDARKAVEDAARRTNGRQELRHKHDRLDDISPEVGRIDQQAVEELAAHDPDEAAALLADLANATDPAVRAQARRLAARLFVRIAKKGEVRRRGVRRLVAAVDAGAGDIDVDATLARTGGLLPTAVDEIVVRRWTGAQRALCLLIDRSGSMTGKSVAMASVAAASVVVAAGEQADCSVLAFARDTIVLQEQGRRRDPERLIGDVLSLRGKGVTDLSLALRGARQQLGRAVAHERAAVLLSDGLATEGTDPLRALRGIDRLHVLGTSDEPASIEAASTLARKGRGRYRTCTSVADLPLAMRALLDD